MENTANCLPQNLSFYSVCAAPSIMPMAKASEPCCITVVMTASTERVLTVYPLFLTLESKIIFLINDGESMQAALTDKKEYFP